MLINLQIPEYRDFNETKKFAYFKRAMTAAGEDENKKTDDMPKHLKRDLALEEILNNQTRIEEHDKKYILWKFGRTTHFTSGVFSHIESNYKSESGVISDELTVVDYSTWQNWRYFSAPGDSGSFVWDSEGYVAGLFWGGKDQAVHHYMMPIEYLLADIREVCGAKEVKLVVRTEDETGAVFGPLEQRTGSGAAFKQDVSSSGVPSLFDDDNKAKGAFDAVSD